MAHLPETKTDNERGIMTVTDVSTGEELSIIIRNDHGLFRVTVEPDGYTYDDRPRYRYRLSADGYGECSGNDLAGGVGSEHDLVKGMDFLCTFFGAWVEALVYGDTTSENRDLFICPDPYFEHWQEFADEWLLYLEDLLQERH